MNDIEKELRNLAIEQRRNVPSALVPQRLKQRVRIRRGLFGLGFISITMIVLAGAMWGLPDDLFKNLNPAAMDSYKPVNCYEIRTKENACPGVELSIELPQQSVPSGGELKGQLVFHNTNPFPVVLDGEQPEDARFLDPSTGRLVGGWEGFVAATGWGAVVFSDETASISLIATAVAHVDDFDPLTDRQPPLPEGEYLLRATTYGGCKPRPGASCNTTYSPAYMRITVQSP